MGLSVARFFNLYQHTVRHLHIYVFPLVYTPMSLFTLLAMLESSMEVETGSGDGGGKE